MAPSTKQRAASRKPTKKSGKTRPKHGGKRDGAGRPRERMPDDLLTDLGEPPTDPLKKSAWWNRLLEVLTYGVLKGKPWVTMLRDAQRTALVQSKLIPEEIKARAAELLEQEDRETREDVSPKTVARKEDPIGRANAGALRRDPS